MSDWSQSLIPQQRQNELDELSQQHAQMTHQPAGPNPAEPYLQGARNFYRGGLTEAFPSLHQSMPAWVETIGKLFQSQAARDALSTANIGGMPLIEAIWTPRDLEMLKKIYSTNIDPNIIAELLPGRSLQSINRKALQLGLKRPETPPARQPGFAPGPVPIKSAPSIPGTYNPAELGKTIKPPKVKDFTPTGELSSMRPEVPKPVNIDRLSRKLNQSLSRASEAASRVRENVRADTARMEDQHFIMENRAPDILARFQGNPNEESLLRQKVESLKIRAKNFGPKSNIGQMARGDAKLILKRLREIEDAEFEGGYE